MNAILNGKSINEFTNVIVWGAGVLGRQTLNMGLPISHVWDVRFADIRSVCGVSVECPLSGNINKNDTLIIVCIGNKQAKTEILDTLRVNDYKNILLFDDVEKYIFSEKLRSFREMNQGIEPGGIVFVGDSIIEMFRTDEYFSNPAIYTRGIGGDTVFGLLTHLDESVFDLNPGKVFVCIGTNDIAKYTSPKSIVEQICELVRKIMEKVPTTEIFIISLLPVYSGDAPGVNKRVVFPRTNEIICELNMQIAAGITKLGAVYVDVYNRLTDDSGQLDIDLTLDGLHLNSKGYAVFAHTLKELL